MFAAADTVSGNSEVTLVANTGQSGGAWLNLYQHDLLQEFTTGSHEYGYTVTKIGLDTGQLADRRTPPVVSIRTVEGGTVGNVVEQFSAPVPMNVNRVDYWINTDGVSFNPTQSTWYSSIATLPRANS